MRLIIATNNPDKRFELCGIIGQRLGDTVEILTLNDVEPPIGEIKETGATLEENALLKAQTVFEHTRIPTIADDSGLEVDALGGAPGVFSARYSGRESTYESNIKKVLLEMKGVKNRAAKFSTVIAYYPGLNKAQLFRGEIHGIITGRRRGSNGFGYDPIFLPDGSKQSFGQMTNAEKNAVSHRALAIEQFLRFMENKK